ncbi:cell filamentation protein [Escherichia coli]|uniref:Cell filamentation protein n=1 Tax=Escherichia coli TaxID=562 RepID=A0A376TXX6_ECOLX|nr:cell filamentation protein [Escherichia coli]
MQDLEEEGYLVGLEKAKFVERLAHYYCEINVLHPFRVEVVWHSGSSSSNWRFMPGIN